MKLTFPNYIRIRIMEQLNYPLPIKYPRYMMIGLLEDMVDDDNTKRFINQKLRSYINWQQVTPQRYEFFVKNYLGVLFDYSYTPTNTYSWFNKDNSIYYIFTEDMIIAKIEKGKHYIRFNP